jgi:putative peptide zinc metalloprotease protein
MFAPESRVTVYPFSVQPDGDEVVLGGPAGAFIAVPRSAIEILDALRGGCSLAEVQTLYFERHGEHPDLADFLAELARRGFVSPAADGVIAAAGPRATAGIAAAAPGVPATGASTDGDADLQAVIARLLFGRAALALYSVLIAAGGAAAALAPAIIPGRETLMFSHHRAVNGLLLLIFVLISTWVHEMGHLLAARATGVKGRLGIGHRLWVPVAETDLSGLWALPRRRRYLPFLAGCIADLASASALLIVLFAEAHRWLGFPAVLRQFLGAMIFIYLMRILWQGYFFVRTDFYYVIGSLTGCKNLMTDTQNFLRNQLARALPMLGHVDQSAIPRREWLYIRLYSVIWLAGRAAALAILVGVTIPVAAYYLGTLFATLRDVGAHPLAVVDSLCMTAVVVLPLLVGLSLWARSLIKAWRTQ